MGFLFRTAYRPLLLLWAIVVMTSAARVSYAQSDPQATTYQINSAHTGSTTLPYFPLPLIQRWSVTFPNTVSYPLIAEGKVFVTTADNSSSIKTIYALSARDGAVLWQQNVPGYYWRIDLAYENGRVFVINNDGLITAYQANNGALIWSRNLPGQYFFSSPPSIRNGILYVGGAGTGGTLYAVNVADGNLLWSAPVANGDNSSPAVTDEGVYVSYAGPQVYKFGLTSGLQLWRYNSGISGGGGRTPVVSGGRVYVRSGSFTDASIHDAATGGLIAYYPNGPAPAFDSGRFYSVVSGSGGSSLTARSESTRSILWSVALPSGESFSAAPIVVNGNVYAGTNTGNVRIYAGATGAPLGVLPHSGPILFPDEFNVSAVLVGLGAGGDILAVPVSKTLVAYGTSAPPRAPANLQAQAGQGQVNLIWGALSEADSYRVKRATASTGPYTLLGTVSGTRFADTTVENGTTYFYVVTALNTNGEGAASNPASATPYRRQGNDSQIVSVSVPAQGISGYAYTTSVTVKNTGTTTWTADKLYRLGSQSPQDNDIFGVHRADLPGGQSVLPGQSVTFTFPIYAPFPGTYPFQWRMVQDLVEWFGDDSAPVNVTTTLIVPTPDGTNAAQFIGQSIPTQMQAGRTYPVTVTFKNTGTATWTADKLYRIGSQSPQDNSVFGVHRVALPASVTSVAPGQEVTFSFLMFAPFPGRYPIQWRMVEDTVEWFGDYSSQVDINVTY